MTSMHVLVALFSISLVMVLIGLRFRRRRLATASRTKRPPAPTRLPCPLCSTIMNRGSRIHSVYYRPHNSNLPVEEIPTHVFGCPSCWPANPRHPRICPVCKTPLSPQGHVVARTFRRQGRRDHVHIIGCTTCKG